MHGENGVSDFSKCLSVCFMKSTKPSLKITQQVSLFFK